MQKTSVVRLAGLAVAVAGVWTVWSQQQRPPLTMEKVGTEMYVIVGNGGNVAVLPTSEGVILVDDKFAQDAPEILAKVKSVTDKPIRYVLNTHQHGDHTGGNEALLAANAELVIQKNARANMVTGKQPGLPRITFGDEAQIFLGGKEVQAHYLGRGHTNGDAVMFFPQQRVLHMGDLFVNGGSPLIDNANGGSIKNWSDTVAKALQYDFDYVIPGHGPVTTKAALAKWVQTMAGVRASVQTACAGGAAEASKKLDLIGFGMKNGSLDRWLPGMCQELAGAEEGFTSLFNGKDLTGWKVNENAASFTVKDGAIVAHGQRSHCFYVGDFHNHTFKNFELKVDVMTLPGSNGGVYVDTAFQDQGFPGKGFEIQVNNTYKGDPRKTASIYAVEDVKEQLVEDNKWFTQDITVQGNTIVVKVDGKVAAQWTQPADWAGTKDFVARRIGAGTVALQGHDAGSTVHYKNIRIKILD